MAKQFAGFTPDQLGKIDPSLQGMQSDEQQKLIAANPALAARVGKMAEMAQQRIGMAQGGYAKKGYAVGGVAEEDVQNFNNSQMAAQNNFNNTDSPQRAIPSAFNNVAMAALGKFNNANSPQKAAPAVQQATAAFNNSQRAAQDNFKNPAIVRQLRGQTRDQNNQRQQEFMSQNRGLFDAADQAQQTIERDVLKQFKLNKDDPQAIEAALKNNPDLNRQLSDAMNQAINNNPAIQAMNKAQQEFAMQQSPRSNQYQELQGAVDAGQAAVATNRTALSDAQQAAAADPENETLQKAVEDAQVALTQSEAGLDSANRNLTGDTTAAEMTAASINDPSSMVTKSEVATISDADRAAGTVATGTGQVGEATTADLTTATGAGPVEQPERIDTVKADTTLVQDDVSGVLDTLTAATGKPSDEALAEAATMSPEELSQLGLDAAQIKEAQRVEATTPRTVQEGEMIEGSTVDMGRVKKETNFEAATGAPSTDATVQGQLTGLMEQFEGKQPPAWAAGAMRAAGAAMAARGLSASSMAGQAVVQAAMESALPIAMQDAQTTAAFEQQNLSNKQQAAMFAAEKRAEFLGMEFNQDFQARVANASKISDIANMNFTAEQQVALENARMAQSVDLANLSAKSAKVLADAAAMTQIDTANLSNRQQANVQAAQAFLEMDMSNLSNEQQTSVFKAQEMVNSMLSDQAAMNAASQFNAKSENQTNQFFTSLASQISQFNVEQQNAMSRFNAGESNALSQFNAGIENARDQFNAQNHLIVAQSNAQWFQTITTTENAAQNQANRDNAIQSNNLTMTAYNNLVQRERDLLTWAWQSAESSKDINARIAVARISADAEKNDDSGSWLSSAAGKFLGVLAENAANSIWN